MRHEVVASLSVSKDRVVVVLHIINMNSLKQTVLDLQTFSLRNFPRTNFYNEAPVSRTWSRSSEIPSEEKRTLGKENEKKKEGNVVISSYTLLRYASCIWFCGFLMLTILRICIGIVTFLSKGCHLDVVRGPSTPHDPESNAGGSLSSWQGHPSR
jgi:hypothetical protein